MTMPARQSRSLAVLQTVILLAGLAFFLVPIATPLGLVAGLAGITWASWLTFRLGAQLKLAQRDAILAKHQARIDEAAQAIVPADLPEEPTEEETAAAAATAAPTAESNATAVPARP